MRFNVVFIATALLSSAAPALSATLTAYAGAGCTGSILAVDSSTVGQCITFTQGSPVKSIGYSGVPNQISFFKDHNCPNGPFLTLGGGSGCVTAPSGLSIVAVFLP